MTVFRVAFERARRGREAVLVEPRAQAATSRPLRVARMLARAHEMQGMIDRGEVRDRTELAERFGFTRGRVTQLMDLLMLAPDIQEELLFLEVSAGSDPIHEHSLRRIVRAPLWSEQRARWARMRLFAFGRDSRSKTSVGGPFVGAHPKEAVLRDGPGRVGGPPLQGEG